MSVQRNSLREQVRDALLQDVATGRLSPGDRVVEAKVAQQLDISAIPVREAIRELVTIGVLESAPHRGAWVREVSLAETIEAFEVRAVLEPLAVEAAAGQPGGDFDSLRAVVESIVDAAGRRDFAAFQQHNQVFHRTIVEASGNRVLLRLWDSLAFEVRTRFVMDFLTAVDPVEIAREHEPIVEALVRGEAGRAAALLKSHSGGLVQYLRDQAATEPAAATTSTTVPP